ncbi:MAG: hypothetical protein FWD03_00435 [Defluviitaleaceae bacterium]|nr:hypothetical protein [Defluviitaleaceae bacterium]
MEKFNCDICGKIVVPNDFGLCKICGWEDDPLQSHDPDYRGGANPDSLNERKAWWAKQNAHKTKTA